MMIPLRCRASVLLALVVFPLPFGRASDLETRIKEITTRPEYKHSRWGILVVDADSGKSIFQQNPDELFAPASVTKLFTCAAALIEFGAEHRFRTPDYRRGEVVEDPLSAWGARRILMPCTFRGLLVAIYPAMTGLFLFTREERSMSRWIGTLFSALLAEAKEKS